MAADPDLLGFAGLMQAGLTESEAWQVIHDELTADAGAMAVIRNLHRTAEGRRTLAWSAMQWASHGLPPPWEERRRR